MRSAFLPRSGILLFLLFCAAAIVPAQTAVAQVTVAQISDTHIGEQHSPHAMDNLRTAVEMINQRHPDAVILSGDIGEGPDNWDKAKSVLKGLKAPLYYAPGNHDVHTGDVDRYRKAFGKDYYRFQVKNVTFLVIDSQLLGNFDHFEAHSVEAMPPGTAEEGEKMLAWLAGQKRGQGDGNDDSGDRGGSIVIGIQHIPDFRDGNFPPDPKPYWVVNDPYRSREIHILHDLGVKDMLVGHWHQYRNFKHDGITWHVAPATSWLTWGGQLGFSIHTISRDGHVDTQFVPLPDQQP